MLYALLGVACLGAGIWLGGRGIPSVKKRVAQATLKVAVDSIAALPEKDRRLMAKAVLDGMKAVERPKIIRKRTVKAKTTEPVAATDTPAQAAA